MRIDECSEHPVPECEGRAKIFAYLVRGGMMNPMVIGCDENPFEGSDVHLQVGMFPELDANAEGVANGALEGGQAKDGDWHHHLRNVVDEGVQKAGAKAREPVKMLRRMVPCMRPPQHAKAMLRSMDPVNDEIDHQNRECDSHHKRKFFQLRWDRGNSGNVAASIVCNQARADSIGDNRKNEREDVELQLAPTISLPGRSNSLPKLKNQHEQQKHENLVIVFVQRHIRGGPSRPRMC